MAHLVNNKLLNNYQHGFLANYSCQSNLLIYLEQVSKNVKSKVPVDVVYLDFAKAFDKVL